MTSYDVGDSWRTAVTAGSELLTEPGTSSLNYLNRFKAHSLHRHKLYMNIQDYLYPNSH